jgi:acyl dehydratase
MKYNEINIGDSKTIERKVSDVHALIFSYLTGDDNSVHKGESGIAYGMLVCSYISALIGNYLPGDGAIWVSHDIDFISPVRINDTITIIGTVHRKDYDTKRIQVMVDIYNQNGNYCVGSTCWVKVAE